MIDSKENYKFDLGVKGSLEIKSLYRLNHKKIGNIRNRLIAKKVQWNLKL